MQTVSRGSAVKGRIPWINGNGRRHASPPAAPETALPRLPWLALATSVFVASIAIGAIDRPEAGVAVALLAGLPLLALRAPLECALLLVVTGWIPLETLFGSEKNLIIANGINVSGARLIGGAIGLALVLWLLRDRLAPAGWARGIRIGLILYVALIAWSAVTLLWSPDPFEGLRGITKLAFPLLLFGVVVANPRQLEPARLLRLIGWTLAAAIAAATLFSLLGTIDRSILPTDETGSVADWYGWAGWTTFALFASIAGVALLALGEHGVFRPGLPAALLALVQIPLTLIRISLGGLAAALVSMFAIGGRRRWLAIVGVVPIILLFTFPPLVEQNVYNYSAASPQIRQTAQGSTDAGGQPGDGATETSIRAIGDVVSDPLSLPSFIKLQGRENLWEQALGLMSGPDWIIGTGFGNWAHLNEGVQGGGALHGEAVHLLFETGVIGLLIFPMAFAFLFVSLARQARRSAPGSAAAASGAAAVGVIAVYLIAGLTDNTLDYYTVAATAWAVIAAAVVCGASRRRPETGAPAEQPGH